MGWVAAIMVLRVKRVLLGIVISKANSRCLYQLVRVVDDKGSLCVLSLHRLLGMITSSVRINRDRRFFGTALRDRRLVGLRNGRRLVWLRSRRPMVLRGGRLVMHRSRGLFQCRPQFFVLAGRLEGGTVTKLEPSKTRLRAVAKVGKLCGRPSALARRSSNLTIGLRRRTGSHAGLGRRGLLVGHSLC